MSQQQEQNSGRIPGIIGALGKFLKGLRDYNLLELLKVLFALGCVTFMAMLVLKPEVFFEQVDKVVESVSQALSSGLPFLYLDLTIEVGAEGEPPLREGEFKDLRTAQYPLINILLDQGYWYGTIEEVRELDYRLSYHLAAHDVSEVAVMTLWNGQSATGFLCLTWHGAHRMNPEPTGHAIRASGTKIAVELALLDRLRAGI